MMAMTLSHYLFLLIPIFDLGLKASVMRVHYPN